MKKLNLGCGSRFNVSWFNVDIKSSTEQVLEVDLTRKLPYTTNSFDIIYSSHVLEHFKLPQKDNFLSECFRILKPQGVIRLVVPDLEKIVRSYLEQLSQLSDTKVEEREYDNYDWLMLELYDQTVREQSGGMMLNFLRSPSLKNADFILQRIGDEAKNIIYSHHNTHQITTAHETKFNILNKLRALKKKLTSINVRESLIKSTIKEEDYQALQIGRFRQSGEVHQWMYDRISLERVLREAGFIDIIQRSATTSYIDHWESEYLDTNEDGSIYKPDSLYMEARKPT